MLPKPNLSSRPVRHNGPDAAGIPGAAAAGEAAAGDVHRHAQTPRKPRLSPNQSQATNRMRKRLLPKQHRNRKVHLKLSKARRRCHPLQGGLPRRLPFKVLSMTSIALSKRFANRSMTWKKSSRRLNSPSARKMRMNKKSNNSAVLCGISSIPKIETVATPAKTVNSDFVAAEVRRRNFLRIPNARGSLVEEVCDNNAV
jgi:hypothetical protein